MKFCSADSGISVGTSSNDSLNGSGDELMKVQGENSVSKILILPFSPLKDRHISEVAVPMFANHKSVVKFNPPVRILNQHHSFECGERMAELLRRLPDYGLFQPEIVQSIYVAQHAPKRQNPQLPVNNGSIITSARISET